MISVKKFFQIIFAAVVLAAFSFASAESARDSLRRKASFIMRREKIRTQCGAWRSWTLTDIWRKRWTRFT